MSPLLNDEQLDWQQDDMTCVGEISDTSMNGIASCHPRLRQAATSWHADTVFKR
jgi:hypothetical protein